MRYAAAWTMTNRRGTIVADIRVAKESSLSALGAAQRRSGRAAPTRKFQSISTIVGVAARRLAGPDVPARKSGCRLARTTYFIGDEGARTFAARVARVNGRLRPGIPEETAEAAVATVGRRQRCQAIDAATPSVSSQLERGHVPVHARHGARRAHGCALLLMLMPGIRACPARSVPEPRQSAARAPATPQLAVRMRSTTVAVGSPPMDELLTEGLLLAARWV